MDCIDSLIRPTKIVKYASSYTTYVCKMQIADTYASYIPTELFQQSIIALPSFELMYLRHKFSSSRPAVIFLAPKSSSS